MSRVGIVVIAAVLVGVISIVQYENLRRMVVEEMDNRSHEYLSSMSRLVEHTLELTEATMRENLWEVKRCMDNPDSMFSAMVHLVDDNPHVAGGFIAFEPYHYRSKGRLFEPYATKLADGSIKVEDIAGPDHDYTLNPEYVWVKEELIPAWTDPYVYGPDSLAYASYNVPILDGHGRLQAVCGVDLSLSWLGDTLNAHQPFHSSFAMLLTESGDFVSGPSVKKTSKDLVNKVVSIAFGYSPEESLPGYTIRKTKLQNDPYWIVVQAFKTEDGLALIHKMRLRQLPLILLALAILTFMIDRYARNERRLRSASESQARMSGELQAARNIQSEMLPTAFTDNIYGSVEPAREVGGDLFDFYRRDGKLFFCIGDVSGKGVPAAMLMSVIHSLFRMVSRQEESPSRILKALNNQICEGNDSNMFVTFFVGCLDYYTGKLYFANAGHDKPFLIGDTVSLLPVKSNLPLGVFPDTEFVEQTLVLTPGQTLLLYTDGLTEAKNVLRQNFGRKRIETVIESFVRTSSLQPKALLGQLFNEVKRYSGNVPQSDDLTMFALRYLPGEIIRDSLVLFNKVQDVSKLSEFIKNYLARLDTDRKVDAALRLALEETVVNVISYAYPEGMEGKIYIYAESDRKEIRFTVVDSGFAFDPTAVLSPDTSQDAESRPIGGLGILLTRKLVDSVSYCRKHGNNVLSLTKRLI